MTRQAYVHRQPGIGVNNPAYPHAPVSQTTHPRTLDLHRKHPNSPYELRDLEGLMGQAAQTSYIGPKLGKEGQRIYDELKHSGEKLNGLTVETPANKGVKALKMFQGRVGKSIAAGLALAYSLALAPPVYANEHESKETETAVSVTEPSKPSIITLLRFEIKDPNLPEQKFDPEYNPRPTSNSTSIVWGIKPQKGTLGNILRHADEPFTRLYGDRYRSKDANTIDRFLCGSGEEDKFGKMYYALKDIGMHTKEDIVLASDLYTAGCITRDPEGIGKAFDEITPEQRNSLLYRINEELKGNFGSHEVKAELDRGLSPRIDGYILKAFDLMYRMALTALGIKALTRAFASGGGHGHSATSSSSNAGAGAGGGAGGGVPGGGLGIGGK